MIQYVSIASALIVATAGLVLVLENISNKHIHWNIKALTIYFWTSSFLPFLLVPVDFSLFNSTPEDKKALDVLWKIYYFLNLFNGQLLLPFVIAYVTSGYAQIRDKLWYSGVEVSIWLGIKAAAFVLSLIVGVLLAIGLFDVKVNVLDFLEVNAIYWLNTWLPQ